MESMVKLIAIAFQTLLGHQYKQIAHDSTSPQSSTSQETYSNI